MMHENIDFYCVFDKMIIGIVRKFAKWLACLTYILGSTSNEDNDVKEYLRICYDFKIMLNHIKQLIIAFAHSTINVLTENRKVTGLSDISND